MKWVLSVIASFAAGYAAYWQAFNHPVDDRISPLFIAVVVGLTIFADGYMLMRINSHKVWRAFVLTMLGSQMGLALLLRLWLLSSGDQDRNVTLLLILLGMTFAIVSGTLLPMFVAAERTAASTRRAT